MDPKEFIGFQGSMKPPFEEKTLAEDADTVLFQDSLGRVRRGLKAGSVGGGRMSMDTYLRFAVKKPEDWPAIKRRYVAGLDRLPSDWGSRVAGWQRRSVPLIFGPNCSTLGFYWWGRELMGTEGLSYAWYDLPALMHEMMEFWADFLIESARPILARTTLDYVTLNEDLAMKTGPLSRPRKPTASSSCRGSNGWWRSSRGTARGISASTPTAIPRSLCRCSWTPGWTCCGRWSGRRTRTRCGCGENSGRACGCGAEWTNGKSRRERWRFVPTCGNCGRWWRKAGSCRRWITRCHQMWGGGSSSVIWLRRRNCWWEDNRVPHSTGLTACRSSAPMGTCRGKGPACSSKPASMRERVTQVVARFQLLPATATCSCTSARPASPASMSPSSWTGAQACNVDPSNGFERSRASAGDLKFDHVLVRGLQP